MGVIFATMFALMFTPDQRVHHFGLFAAVGAAVAALATVLVSLSVLRWSRNRMTVVTAVLFCCADLRHHQRLVVRLELRRPVQQRDAQDRRNQRQRNILALFAVAALYTVWLHITARWHGEGRLTWGHRRAHHARRRFRGAGEPGVDDRGGDPPVPHLPNGWSNLEGPGGGCGLADDVLVEPGCQRRVPPTSWELRTAGPTGRNQAGGLHPQRCAGEDCR